MRLGDLKRNNVFRLFQKTEGVGMVSGNSIGRGEEGWIKEIQEVTLMGLEGGDGESRDSDTTPWFLVNTGHAGATNEGRQLRQKRFYRGWHGQ